MAKMSSHGKGIMLVPAATETEAFSKYVWERADSVLFIKSRPHFYFVDGTRAKANCGTAIVLVSYSSEDTQTLESSKLGKLIHL